MSLKKVKQYLISSDKIVLLLERLGLRNIKLEQNGTLLTCGLPDSNNKRSVQIRINNRISMIIRNKNIKGDIVDLISYMNYEGFGKCDEEVLMFLRDDSIRWLVGNLDQDFEGFEFNENISYDTTSYNKEDFLKDNAIYDDIILEEFISIPHISWFKEKISWNAQKEFGIRYNSHDNQIVIPCRNPNGDLVSIKVRNLSLGEEDDDYFIKYYSLLKPSNGVDLYGLWKTKVYIKKEQQVILFESEKSVIKAWQYGYKNAVALSTSSITDRHKKQLLEFIDDGAEIIIALDNDMEMIDIKRVAKKFKKHNFKISYIKQDVFSKNPILTDKDAPVDRGKKIFNDLFINRKSLI